jgi:L-malate glycosyltransferase
MKHMSRGEKLKFVIVGEETLGSEGGHLEELKEMVRQFGLEESVVFAGYQENIPEVMRAFDVFVMPSRQEAFGLVAIEAMAMECPILISSGGSAEEIVGSRENGEFGLTVRPDDAFDLQNQLRFLIDHPIERVQMGQRGRQHVKANYDRQIRIQRTLNLYDRVLRARGVI